MEREELKDFSKFIESPFFNKDEKVIKLFDYLKKYHPVFETKKLDREYISAKLFPEWKGGNAYKKLSYIMSSLSQLADDFFVWREIEQDKSEHYQFMLKAYKRRKGDWFFESTAEEFQKYLEKKPERGTDYYFHQYRMNEEIYTHNATNRIETGIESLESAINNLDLFYFGKKFMYCSEIRLREMHLSDKSELILLDEMLETVKHPIFKNKTLIHIFSNIIYLYETKNKVLYDELKLLIFENFDQFNTEEKLDIVKMTNNFCLLEYNQGKSEYLIEIFELYEYGLNHNIWITEEVMDHAIFDNIVGAACNLKKFDWVEIFIKKYSVDLREEVRESVKIMALCRLEFSMNNFEKTLELLRDVEFVDIQYNLNAKVFQLRSYYELDGYEVLFYDACNAFAQYCRRNKVIGKQHRELYLSFISFVKRLHQAKYQRTEGKKELLERLETTPAISSSWLKEKIENDIKD